MSKYGEGEWKAGKDSDSSSSRMDEVAKSVLDGFEQTTKKR